MTQLTFDKSLALSIYQSNEPFPVSLDFAWQWIGWGKKQTAKDTLINNFSEGEDFARLGIKSSGGRPSEVLMLTIDCFKMLGMIAGTEQGKVIRKYFLECERIAKQAIARDQQALLPPIDTSKIDTLALRQAQLQGELAALEVVITATRNELQAVIREKAIEAKAYIDKYPDAVSYALKCSEIVAAYGDGNKYAISSLRR